MNFISGKNLILLFVIANPFSMVLGQEGKGGGNAQAQANNPLANMTAFNIQNYYISELSGFEDETANQTYFWGLPHGHR